MGISEIQDNETWLSSRKKGIGGSDVSAIIGKNPYMSNIDLWKIKTGKEIKKDISDKDCVQYGHSMEPLLIEMFRIDNPQYEVGHKDYDLRVHKDYSFIIGSLDGFLVDKETGEKGVLEIKTCQINKYNFDNWKGKIPINYYCQVLHYLLVTNYDFAIVFALLKFQNSSELKTFKILKSEVQEEINFLKEKEIEFWTKYVLQDIEPNLIINL
jgi:putative phage-type endonuclease